MLTLYDAEGNRLARRDGLVPCLESTVWLDLLNPTPEEDRFVEQALGIAIPTRAEMREIEASSRFYQESGAYFMTATILYAPLAGAAATARAAGASETSGMADNGGAVEKPGAAGSKGVETLPQVSPSPAVATLTFILAGSRLVTVRYTEPQSFPLFLQRLEKGDALSCTAPAILIGLIETMIDRAADRIERLQDEVERIAQSVFDIKGGQQTRSRRLDVLLRSIGREGDITSKVREGALSLDRLLTYFAAAARDRRDDPRVVEHIETARRDVASLTDHARFLSDRITFLLDATLGMISIEQNGIIKIFSVASVALMPPTLIASIYGMNFKEMPELAWPWGYPMALCLMVISAVVPFVYFRRKGWF
jgi:magnesium transporter